MSAQHTPEPWVLIDEWGRPWIQGFSKASVANCCLTTMGGTTTERANARRIVACVNACADIDEPEETIKGMQFEIETLKRMINPLKQQRDELKTAWANAAADLEIMKLERDELLAAVLDYKSSCDSGDDRLIARWNKARKRSVMFKIAARYAKQEAV